MEGNNIISDLDLNLYNEILLKESILISPDNFNNNINKFIEENLKNKIEEKCIAEGYVKKDSINIIKKSIGSIKGNQFNGYINYDLLYTALVCSPKNGTIIKCKVKLVNNKLGLLGNNGPLTIIVGKQLHNNPDLLDNINIDDIVEVKVIETKYSLNDKEIKILAKLSVDIDIIKKMNDDDEEKLNEIDNSGIDDSNLEPNNEDIDKIELESLDGLSSDSETESDEEKDIDDMEDIDDIDEEKDEDEDDIDEEKDEDDIDEEKDEDEDLDELEETSDGDEKIDGDYDD